MLLEVQTMRRISGCKSRLNSENLQLEKLKSVPASQASLCGKIANKRLLDFLKCVFHVRYYYCYYYLDFPLYALQCSCCGSAWDIKNFSIS